MPNLKKPVTPAQPGPIRVALAEDNEYFCLTAQNLLEADGSFHYMGHAPTVRGFKKLVSKAPPQVALLDLDLTRPRDGMDILVWLRERHPSVRSVILTVNEKEISECYKLGARGYLLKSQLDNLAEVIRTVHAGSLIIPPGISDLLIDQMKEQSEKEELRLRLKELSQRELEVLKLFTRGLSRPEIAKRLCISTYTIRRHVGSILKKEDLSSIKSVISRYKAVL